MVTAHSSAFHLYNIGINYQKADTQLRGEFSLSPDQQIRLLAQAKAQGLPALFVLSTCNRTEIMGFARNPYELISLLVAHANGDMARFTNVASVYKGAEAVEHLFRTATGLNSQIPGDHEIIGQLKNAFQQAQEAGMVDNFLSRLFDKALAASKDVKTNTAFSRGITSVAFAGVQFLQTHFGDLHGKNILLYGAGKMGCKACRYLLKQGANVTLINRSQHKALALQAELPALNIAPVANLTAQLAQADALLVATGATTPTVLPEHIPVQCDLLMLDLSIPPNISPAVKQSPKVQVVDLDSLSQSTTATVAQRESYIPVVEKIVEQHKNAFLDWVSERELTPIIQDFKTQLQAIQQRELAFLAQKSNNFNAEDAQYLSDRLIQKTMAQFVQYLKTAQA